MNFYKYTFKTLIDFFAAAILLILLSPIILGIIILLAIVNRSSVFFLQTRSGYHSRPFKIIKFKTMRDAYDESGNLLPDEIRLTKVGKYVRAASLDELLQLINVLKGDMSLVGPRPLLMKYLDRYTQEQARRHQVKPGITGWAQVNGRNAISWEEKFNLDVWYVENISFKLDINILFLTVIKIFRREGINAPGQATADYFKGSKQMK